MVYRGALVLLLLAQRGQLLLLSHCLCLPLFLSLSYALSLSLSLSRTHTLYFSHTQTHTLYLSISLSLCLSVSQTLSHRGAFVLLLLAQRGQLLLLRPLLCRLLPAEIHRVKGFRNRGSKMKGQLAWCALSLDPPKYIGFRVLSQEGSKHPCLTC